MNTDELLFFNSEPDALPLYEIFRTRVLKANPDPRIEVRKTQISFFSRHLFAAVSFLPIRKAKERPRPYLTVTFSLPYRKESPRVDAVTEPYPNRWTHHVMIGRKEELNDELFDWIREAAVFAERK